MNCMLGIVLTLTALITRAIAQDSTAPPDPNTPTGNIPTNELGTTLLNPDKLDNLPEIEAKTWPVKILKKSKSNKIYLIEDINNSKTKVGKILLFKREAEPFIAARVLRTYSDRKQIAVKKLRSYENHDDLPVGGAFVIIEKVADILPETIDKTANLPLSKEDKADLEELEPKSAKKKKKQDKDAEPAADSDAGSPQADEFDPELDSGTSPKPADETAPDDEKPQQEESALVVEEVEPIEIHRHWFTVQGGAIFDPRYDPEAGFDPPMAGGLRYGFTFARMVFISKPLVQDSFAIEAGAFLYKIFQYADPSDVYTVMPTVFTARYNLALGHNLLFFLYGGTKKNFVVDSANNKPDALSLLSQYRPALGGGILIGIVSNWDVRIDAGFDMAVAGLTVRF